MSTCERGWGARRQGPIRARRIAPAGCELSVALAQLFCYEHQGIGPLLGECDEMHAPLGATSLIGLKIVTYTCLNNP